ncbi:MAG: hypothetical protein NTX51_07135 [Verrucomicrobia bacterium]|nr:hypothetical protein [Verrucomicrobiota bacterium]
MPKNLILILAAAASLLAAGRTSAQLSVPPALNYQGVLTPIGGVLTPGFYTLAFRLYAAPVGGSPVWARSFTNIYVGTNATVNCTLNDAGAELLPSGTSILVAAMTNTPPVYLGLTVVQTPAGAVASPMEIVPRWPFLSVPYSLTAAIADNAHALNTPTPMTNLLALGTPSWPPGNYALGYANPGGAATALPMANAISMTNNGLAFSGGLFCQSNLLADQLVIPGISYQPVSSLFKGPIHLLQPAGSPQGVPSGTNFWTWDGTPSSFTIGYTNGASVGPKSGGVYCLTTVNGSLVSGQFVFNICCGTNANQKLVGFCNTPANTNSLAAMGFVTDPAAARLNCPMLRFIPANPGGYLWVTPTTAFWSSGGVDFLSSSFLPFGAP